MVEKKMYCTNNLCYNHTQTQFQDSNNPHKPNTPFEHSSVIPMNITPTELAPFPSLETQMASNYL
jgi:hypothetical protein